MGGKYTAYYAMVNINKSDTSGGIKIQKHSYARVRVCIYIHIYTYIDAIKMLTELNAKISRVRCVREQDRAG